MILLQEKSEKLFAQNDRARMLYERSFYSMRDVLLRLFELKGVTDYRKFKTMVLAYFPNCCVLDIAAFWDGITFKESFFDKLDHVLIVANNKMYESLKSV